MISLPVDAPLEVMAGPVHELRLCQASPEAVERRAERRHMTGVEVQVGTLHCVVEPALDLAFVLDAVDTKSPSP